MADRLNPQPLPPVVGPREADIPIALLQSFKTDMRIVHGPIVAGLIMVPPELLAELQAKLGAKLAVLIVNKSEISE